ncbi:hypothetical protein EHE19_008720 [Ruminiclostridium herbifermentans]|uniref:Uncharacterized protein n=1 Tax=Ruminiclostridium herbifermentans TaxID=2488810 RepID=A0A4U7JJ88_9FIRM|nr:hypothetical protein [Ruminiclostridium herbifermentans]QNU68462.1 hypothetical protein EHE19_008720 [Ruminiclostridium herbifermentans]
MLRQIRQLTAVQLYNLFGFNEFRFSKDKKVKKRWIGMTLIWVFLIIMLLSYVSALCIGLSTLGMARVIPEYLFVVISFVILFFSFLKAGSVIFQMNNYEILVSLPVSRTAIVVSRFFTMYITNLIMSFLIMIPGIFFYGMFETPSIMFYIFSVIGTLFLPLLPITLATAIGAGITAISSRMKHKSLISAMLTILFAVGIILFSSLSGNKIEGLSEEVLKNYASLISTQIQSIYPPAAWFGKASVNADIGYFLLLIITSVGIFSLTIFILQRYFTVICSTLNASSAKNNYSMGELKTASPVKALFYRELKRYFASSVYVSNTLIGYLLMAIAAVALLIMGPEKLEAAMELPGVVEKTLPIIIGAMGAIMPTTAASISMEGKQWWIAKTIPVKSKDIFDSKILLNLSIAFPFYIIAVILSIIAAKPSFIGGVWIVLIPAVYILFSAVAGITVNLALPVMKWDNEVTVVKQSASALVTMLVSFVSILIPVVALFTIKNVSVNFIMGATLLILFAITGFLYARNNKKQILNIE